MMLKTLVGKDPDDQEVLIGGLNLNWEKDSPLLALFKKEVKDQNLLLQLRTVLRKICILDCQLETNPDLIWDEDFKKKVRTALHDFVILISCKCVAYTKKINDCPFYIEISVFNCKIEYVHVIKDISLYLK